MKEEKIRLLVIEDEEFDVQRISNTLAPYQERIDISEVVSSGKEALNALRSNPEGFDVSVMDYQISGGLYGEELIRDLKKLQPTLQILVITKMTINQTNIHFANQLLNSGAFWYGTKYPGDIEDYIYQPTDFVLSILNAYGKKQLEMERIRSHDKLDKNINMLIAKTAIIGESPAIQDLRQQIQKYALPNASILILGESGTGKELVARNLHYFSKRKYENFVTVNCASIPKELMESELFGFEKGAFTGAREPRQGLFEQANHGTIFLDEITELPPEAQGKLLRVLQEGEIDKIGRKKNYDVDVRVIAATNRDIEELLDKKTFREDLFYRLNILQIKVPPLRERLDDIPLLTKHFLNIFSRDMGISKPGLSKEAMETLSNYRWPGNVRQLKNVVNRIVILGSGEIDKSTVQHAIDMDKRGRTGLMSLPVFQDNRFMPLKQMETEFRKQYVQFVRNNCRTDAEAAEKLGYLPPNFHRLCKELGLK